MAYIAALLPPEVNCTSCEVNDLTDRLYELLKPTDQDDSFKVEVGGSFFGNIAGFKLSSAKATDQMIILHNTTSVDAHLRYGFQPDYLIIEDAIFYTKNLDSGDYSSLFEEYSTRTIVGYDVSDSLQYLHQQKTGRGN